MTATSPIPIAVSVACAGHPSEIAWTAIITALITIALQNIAQFWVTKRLDAGRHLNASMLHDEKARLDLYDRRFAAYTSCLDFYAALIEWKKEATPEQIDARRSFFIASKEAQFLFSQESGIPEIMKNIHTSSLKVTSWVEQNERMKSVPELYITSFQASHNFLVEDFQTDFKRLEDAIRPYLDFTRVTGKGIR